MTDRDVTRGGWPPDDGQAGRPDWYTASAPRNDPGPAAGRRLNAGQADGWTAPARPPGAYGPPGASPAGSPGSSAGGAYGAPPSAPAGSPGPSAGGAYGSAGPSGAGAYASNGSGAYGGYGGAAPGQPSPSGAAGSPGGWAPPRSGAYGGAPPAGPTAPTVPQNPGWPPTPAPAPGYGPGSSYPPGGGPAYGPPGGFGGPPLPPPGAGSLVRHRPGLGLVLGLVGAGALVLSLTSLPWADEGGMEASFSDIREAYEDVDLDDLTNAPMANGQTDTTTPTTIGTNSSLPPPQTTPDGSVLPPIGPVVEPELPSAPDAADAAGNTGKNAFLEFYTAWGWIGVLAGVSLAILFATLVVPSAKGGRMVTGFFTAGVLGLLLNAADDEGKFGPRISGAIAALGAAVLHLAAIFSLFSEDLAPDPALGVWVGVVGLVIVVVACLVGTRSERVAAGYR